jgi:hypothetical protein
MKGWLHQLHDRDLDCWVIVDGSCGVTVIALQGGMMCAAWLCRN